MGFMGAYARPKCHRQHDLRRHFYNLNATPDDCENDQMHAIFEKALDDEIRELSARCKNWLLRPQEELLGHGMNFMTQRGYQRGAHHYIIAASLARLWARWPQEHCLATFVKVGTIPRELAAMWVHDCKQGDLETIMSEFNNLQTIARKARKWQHIDQSGIAKNNEEPVVWRLQLDWSWIEVSGAVPTKEKQEPSPQQLQALADIRDDAANVMAKSALRDLLKFIEQLGSYEKASSVPESVVGPEDWSYRPLAGALASLETQPGPLNASQPTPFKRCMQALFQETPTFKRRGPAFMDVVWEYQLWLLTNSWIKSKMDQHISVKKVSKDEYMWRTM